MEIEIKRNAIYYSVKITDGSATIDLGLHDKAECAALAAKFRDAADDLSPQESLVS